MRSAASELGIAKRSAYDMVGKLVHLGYVRAVPGTKSPILYEKGCFEYSIIGGKVTLSQGAAECAPSPDEMRTVPDPRRGVYAGKECPDGYVEAHVSGSMSMTVVQTGNFEDPIMSGLGHVGYWKREITRLNGSDNRYGSVSVDYQDVGIGFRQGDKGSIKFTLSPSRIFLDPMCFASKEEAWALFIDRALKVATVLRNTGWILINPVLDGKSTFEYAIRNHPLVHFIKGPTEGCDITVDGSPGCPEAEMKNPDSWERVQYFANIPRHMEGINAKAENADAKADAALGLAARADSGLSDAMARMDAIELMIDRMVNIQEKTAQIILNNTENIANLACATAERPPVPYRPELPGKKLEGYQ